MVKSNNFFLKTVELSWREHRQNVTPATRASSIAQRDVWEIWRHRKLRILPEVRIHSSDTYFLWKQNSAISLYRLKSNALFWMHQQFLAWKKRRNRAYQIYSPGHFLNQMRKFIGEGRYFVVWIRIAVEVLCYKLLNKRQFCIFVGETFVSNLQSIYYLSCHYL